MMKLFPALCAALCAVCCIASADESASEKKAPASDFSQLQSTLKTKDPEGYAKVEKLAATDLEAAMREFRELAAKHNLRMPFRRFQGGEPPFRGGREGGGEGGRDRRGPGGDRGGRRGGMNPLGQFSAESEIAEKFPEDYAKVSAELSAAENKMAKLAERAGVEYRVSLSTQLRELRAKAPARFAEVERLAKESPMEAWRELMQLAKDENVKLSMPFGRGGRGPGGPGGPGGRGHGGPGGNGEMRRVNAPPPMGRLREAFPEEMKRYESLRDSDPKAAETLLRGLVEQLKSQDKPQDGKRRSGHGSAKGRK